MTGLTKNEEQIDLLKKSHFIFLMNELFDIVKLTSTDKFINPIYEDNLDILENQIQVSEKIINEIFKPFLEKTKIKKNLKEQKIKERIWKGANSCMIETENIREIKVAVKINKD